MARPSRRTAASLEATSETEGPRRSALLQDRSRRTRRNLVRAALALWTERGFDRGVEETTVAEIARAAKVTKGTFYFHFAHKEDILLELGWGTAEALYEEAIDGLASQIPAEKILDGLLVTLARRVGSVPKVAVARSVAQFLRQQRTERDRPHFGLRRAFIAVLAAGQKEGLLPESADVDEISVMTEVLAMDAVLGWAYGSEEPLVNVLRRRIDIVMEGARRSAAELPAMPSSGRRRTTGRSSATVRKSAS